MTEERAPAATRLVEIGGPLAVASTGVAVTNIAQLLPDVLKSRGPGSVPSKDTSSDTAGNPSRGCHGNPTDAPPDTPVGPRGFHTGPPVTHPGPGGCGH